MYESVDRFIEVMKYNIAFTLEHWIIIIGSVAFYTGVLIVLLWKLKKQERRANADQNSLPKS